MTNVLKKTVLITGCSTGGIGWAMAKNFHQRGFYVFATARNLSKTAELAELSDIEVLELDVTVPKTIAQCKKIVAERTGGSLDVLVNNAGVEFNSPLLDTDIAEAKRLYDVNVGGPLAMVQAFVPLLIEARGVVFNQSSIDGALNMVWAGKCSVGQRLQLSLSLSPSPSLPISLPPSPSLPLSLPPSLPLVPSPSLSSLGSQANPKPRAPSIRHLRQLQVRHGAHVRNLTRRARAAGRARADVHMRLRRHAHVRESRWSHGPAGDVVLPRRPGCGVEGADGPPAPGHGRRCARWEAGQGYCWWG